MTCVVEWSGWMFAMWFQSAPGGLGSLGSLALPILFFVALYFLMIAPSQRKQKICQQMLSQLKSGDRVTTTGGLRGTVLAVKDDDVALQAPAVVVLLRFGIVGIPHGSLAQSIKDRIHVGLDLKGASHLVLEVHVAEAVASATDRDVARIEDAFQKAGITGATVGKTDPARPQTIVVSGIPPAKLADARSILQSNEYSSYDVTVTADGTASLTMKLAAIRDLETRTLDTSIETIQIGRASCRERV